MTRVAPINPFQDQITTIGAQAAANAALGLVEGLKEKLQHNKKPQEIFDEVKHFLPGGQNKRNRKIIRTAILCAYLDLEENQNLTVDKFLKLLNAARPLINDEGKKDGGLKDLAFNFFAKKPQRLNLEEQDLRKLLKAFPIDDLVKNFLAKGESLTAEDVAFLQKVDPSGNFFLRFLPKMRAKLIRENEPLQTRKFAFAKTLLDGKTIADFIDPSKIAEVMEEFGITEQYSAQRLFNLYLLQEDGWENLQKILSETAIIELSCAYSSNKKINFEEDASDTAFLANDRSIGCGALCDYFIGFLNGKIKHFTEEQCRNFVPADAEFAKGMFGDKLKKLLAQGQSPTYRGLRDFLEAVVGRSSISLGIFRVHTPGFMDSINMVNFWSQNRHGILTLLEIKGGLKDLIACLNTISHGCFTNIGTQFTSALYTALLKEEKVKTKEEASAVAKQSEQDAYQEKLIPDALIYRVLMDNIVYPALNSGGDVMGFQSNPLLLSRFKSYQISAAGFFEKLKGCFNDNFTIASGLIGDVLGDEYRHQLLDFVPPEDAKREEFYLTCATYCALKGGKCAQFLDAPPIVDFKCGMENNKKLREFLDKALAPKTQLEDCQIARLSEGHANQIS